MTPTLDPTHPGALARLRARFEAVDSDLAALALDGVADDAAACALVETLPEDDQPGGPIDAYDRRDLGRLKWWASGARWRSVVPLDELQRREGGLLDIHRQHLAADLLAGHLLRELEAPTTDQKGHTA